MRTATATVVALLFAASASAQPTAITYQGQLKSGGAPANGNYNLTFKVFSASTGGFQLGPTVSAPGTPVAAGLLTKSLDFGTGVFNGQPRWLEVTVNGTALIPRQAVTSAPSALSALSALTASTVSLPYADTTNSATGCAFSITNTGNGNTICGSTTGNGDGVHGTSNGGTGVYGSGGSYGIFGLGNIGVRGEGSIAVDGDASSYGATGVGVRGSGAAGGDFTGTTWGVYASATPAGTGGHFDGLIGVKASGTQRSVEAIGGSEGVYGEGYSGVSGFSSANNGNGVVGDSNNGTDAWGVSGHSSSGVAVIGRAGPTALGAYPGTAGTGVFGVTTASAGRGVLGQADAANGRGVHGVATSTSGVNFGVVGETASSAGFAGYFLGCTYCSGPVGIGTATPTQQLHVIGNILASGTITPSSAKLKENVQPIRNALEGLAGLEAVRFDWKPEEAKARGGRTHDLGFIAEDVANAFPEVVFRDDHGEILGLDYSRMSAVAVGAIKELRVEHEAEIRTLRQEIEALQQRLAALETLVQGLSRR